MRLCIMFRTTCFVVALAFLWVLIAACPAGAINIDFRTLATTTHPSLCGDGGNPYSAEPPANDPNSALLLAVLQHVGSVYEDAIEDPQTIEITYWWDTNMTSGGQSKPCDIVESNGQVTHAMVRFNSTLAWYLDPTPADDSEYSMQQSLYSFGPNAITPAQQTARFTGNVPSVFEAGYNGAALTTAPIAAQTNLDLVTVAFQEVGHSLGMNAGFSGVTNGSNTGEVDDGDYDIASAYVDGNVMAMLPRGGTTDPLDHLQGNDAVMGFLGGSERTRPSAADFFAIAATSNWTNIDLPRKDFLSGASWHTSGNWLGNDVPLSLDDVYIRHGAATDVTLAGNAFAANLLISESSDLVTGANKLDIGGTTTLQLGGGAGDTRITISQGGELESDVVNINQGGRIALTGGLVEANRLTIADGATLSGFGAVDVAEVLVNDGTIAASGNGTLIFTSAEPTGINLDGDGNAPGIGTVDARLGNLSFDSGFTDAFDGTMFIGTGRTATFNYAWTLGDSGLLQLNEDSTSGTATVTSTITTVEGTVLVAGLGRFNSQVEFRPSAAVSVPASDYRLTLAGQTTYQGGTFTGDGTIVQTGNAIISGNTEIDVAVFDLDGAPDNNTVTINAGRTLTINSPQIETSAINDYDGTLNLNSGSLFIAPSWRLDGTLNLTNTGGGTPTVDGNGVFTVHSTGQVIVSGNAIIVPATTVVGAISVTDGVLNMNGPVQFSPTAQIDLENGTRLELNDIAMFAGGSYVGNGRIKFDGPVNVISSTSLGVAETDWDGDGSGSTTVNSGVTFSINSNFIEPTANDGYDGVVNVHSGTLSVLAGWRLDETLNLVQTDRPASSVNGVGTFRVHNGAALNTTGDAVVNAPITVAGNMHVYSGATDLNGTTVFEPSADVILGADVVVNLNGPTTIEGGSFTGVDGSRLVVNADTDVTGFTTIDMPQGIVDLDGFAVPQKTITLHNRTLTLNVAAIDTGTTPSSFDSETININGALAGLRINLTDPRATWEMAGTINISGLNILEATALDGSDILVSGAINVSGLAATASRLDIAGTIATAAAARLRLGAANGDNRHSLLGGVISGPGTLTAFGTNALVGHGTIAASIDFADDTELLASGGQMTLSGPLVDLGRLIGTANSTGMLHVTNLWNTNLAEQLRLRGGSVTGAAITNDGVTTGFGAITSASFANRNLVQPGLPIGMLAFQMYRQTATGVLSIELAGTNFATEHDAIRVIDLIVLDGSLEVLTSGGFVPLPGMEFDILLYGTRNGDFAGIQNHTSFPGLLFNMAYDDPGGIGTLRVAGLPGDINLDGHVNQLDAALFTPNLGSENTVWISGDFNNDAQTTLADMNILQSHLGQSLPGIGPSPSAVPEPSSLGLAAAAALALWMRGRKTLNRTASRRESRGSRRTQ